MKKIDSSKLEKLNKNELIHYIKKLHDNQDLGLNWEDKEEVVVTNLEQKLPILSEIKKNELKNDKNNSSNLIIEGDNYYSLLNLNYTHEKKIDVIYIDPPYNTGEDFMFNDKLVDKDDEWKHSKWLSFMSKRLSLSKKLLTKSGVILISIDDHQVEHLKLLCNEIFGEDKFVATIVWQKRYSRENREAIGDAHEYILVYAMNKKLFKEKRNKITPTEEQLKVYRNPNNDPKGRWRPIPIDAQAGHATKDQFYSIKTPSGKIHKPPKGRCWGLSEKQFKEELAKGRIYFGKNNAGVPNYIRYLSEVDGFVPWTWWPNEEVGHTDEAKKEIHSILNYKEDAFPTPKPVRLMKRILQIVSKKNSIILDFFAGSGTTGHAALELNKKDGGNRKFILSTNNENEICTKICYPRINKAMNGYTDSKKKKIKGLGGNLKYFKIDFVDAKPNDANKKKLSDASTEMLCIKEDCFKEIESPKPKLFRIFAHPVIPKSLFIIYDNDGIQPCIDMIKKHPHPDETNVAVYVHSLDESAAEDEFEEAGLENKVTLMPIPSGIIRMFERLSHG